MKTDLVYLTWEFFIGKCKAIEKKKNHCHTQLVVLLAMCLGLVNLHKERLLMQ